ncbi:MAG: DNA-directed RNA polymerase subunit omega [Ezakiella sp.]
MYNPSTKVIGENESRYTLVMVVAKRARQLVAGSPKKVETDLTNPISIALEEMKEGKIDFEERN